MLSPVDFVVAGHLGCNNHSEDTPEAAEDPNNQNWRHVSIMTTLDNLNQPYKVILSAA